MNSIFEKYGITPYGQTPNENQIRHIKLEKKAFFHFGVNTFTGKEWGLGDEVESLFNPTSLDTRQWIKTIKDAGFKLAIITAKHHDGFCLWPSAYTTHTVAASPYKNGKGDVVREFVDACREFGVLVGIYISPWDRSVKEWGTPLYNDFYNNQLTELLTNYGRIDEVWWDGAGSTEANYDWGLWYGTVRRLQPTAAVLGGTADGADLRWVGNETGVAGTTHYGSINMDNMTNYPPAQLNSGHQNGFRFLYSETDVSIRPGWFYHESQTPFVKNPAVLDNIWFTSVGRNSNMLLNFPPDKTGRVNPIDAEYAKISHENIEKMRASNFAIGASISADSTLAPELSAANLATLGALPYASAKDKTSATLDIVLTEKKLMNVLVLSEDITMGERISSFTLEAVTDDGNKLLAEGTSVGYCRAIKFEEGEYQHLRLTISAAASVILSSVALHYYTAPEYVEREAAYGINLVKERATVVSEDGKEAVLSFGGIFDFNYASAKTTAPAEYELLVFDGTSFIPRTKGVSTTDKIEILLPKEENGSYQIKLISSSPFAENPCFTVKREKTK